ncbi:FAD binding domain protein [Aspergillus parasiticus SU-1]|uniref:FAD binding domain protein n=1 Tax=Aspergillus parasiticus (strain ATCC 56775 / NRRL 5862 / SRRC 143 / SU-1) TaxID=1403190 RepID=A0A0F0I566_ASPPU|nr:FAD binding domain protein [Aspergillus parasiticus SU-1]
MHFTNLLLLLGAPSVLAKCRCAPTDACWPSASKWNDLNSTVHGHLIANEPLAKSCYDGLVKDSTQCQRISKVYRDAFFREASPIGFAYPVVDTCAPINGSIAGSPVCDLGSASVYSVNATGPADVAAGIKFAKENNVRLVVKNTGHDVRARSQGYGSLSIWMKHIKPELQFQERYEPSNNSCQSNWTGSAIVVGAGYIWNEVYTFAAKHDHIAVGGSSKTVGAVGGYLQGGGHGPASHDFGLEADQVLEFKVVLASGEVVTASACEHVELFTALRGGGGGTFGVVLSATLKVYPTRPVLKHSLTIAAPSTNMSALIDASVAVLSKYPILSDAGFSGNGQLNRVLGTKSAYSHDFIKMLSRNSSSSNSSSEIEEAQRVVNKQVVDFLRPLNGTKLSVTSTFEKYDTFQDYFDGGNHESPALNNPSPVMVSRFFDKESLVNNQKNLTAMFHAIFPQSVSKVQAVASLLEFCLVGGGEVLKAKPHTAIHPAWRKTYMFAENFDVPPSDSGMQGVRQIRDYGTSKKLQAMKAAAPGLGTYLNEADPYDPDWKKDFYGDQYNWLKSVKQKYDPDEVFWCYRCVGYEGWEEITGPTLYGPLCQTNNAL